MELKNNVPVGVVNGKLLYIVACMDATILAVIVVYAPDNPTRYISADPSEFWYTCIPESVEIGGPSK